MHKKRINQIQKKLLLEKVDFYLVEDPKHLFYFTSLSVSTGSLLITPDNYFLFLDGRYTLYASTTLKDKITIYPREQMATLFPGHLGLFESRISYQRFLALQSMAAQIEWRPARWVETMRQIKDEEEIASLKKAIDLSIAVFKKVPSLIFEGISEKELAAKIAFEGACLGADKHSFDSIIAFGENSAIVHHHPSNRPLKKGDLALIDIGFYLNHYTSDMTRLFAYGTPPEPLLERVDKMLQMVDQLIALCYPGQPIAEIQKMADTLHCKWGFGDKMAHTFGHGVGLEVHEGPFVSDKTTLEKGMVITIEPGIYQEGLGGARVEEMVLVDTPPVVLTSGLSRHFKIIE